MFDVSGTRAIITGGAQGFGREFARRLLQKGCRVCVTDLDETKGLEAKEELKKQFGLDDDRFEQLKVFCEMCVSKKLANSGLFLFIPDLLNNNF